MEEMMSNRKNAVSTKSAAKSVVKPVANTAHSHSDLELSLASLKKQCSDCSKELSVLKSEVDDLKSKLALLSKNPDNKVDLLISCLKNHGGLALRKELRAKGV
jgi:hypothetical protein